MTRRETYPCANLNGTLTVVKLVSENNNAIKSLVKKGVNKDDIRFAELLELIKSTTSSTKYFIVTDSGEKMLSYDQKRRNILFFCLLMKDNPKLPTYFNQLINNDSLHDKLLKTSELSNKLNMNDLWSADILNEWCRALKISESASKTEAYISSNNISIYKKESFKLALYDIYCEYAGTSKLVPVSKIRREIKNSGILGPYDDFDKILRTISDENYQIEYYPAPSRFVGIGLEGKRGYELISISTSFF